MEERRQLVESEPLNPLRLRVEIAGSTDRGLVRSVNEDSYVILQESTVPSWCSAVVGIFDETFHVATTHKLGDHVGLPFMLPQVEDGDDVRVGAEAAHGVGLSGDAGAGDLIQPLSLDEGEGHFPVEERVLG